MTDIIAVELRAGATISPQVTQSPVIVPTVTGVAGPVGQTGSPGPAGGSITATAAITLSGHRVVRSLLDGTMTYADASHLDDAPRDLWLTTQAATAGAAVTCQFIGAVTEPSWSWVDAPIFLGLNGLLTQTPPTAATAAFIRQVAYPTSPTTVSFSPRMPIVLATPPVTPAAVPFGSGAFGAGPFGG